MITPDLDLDAEDQVLTMVTVTLADREDSGVSVSSEELPGQINVGLRCEPCSVTCKAPSSSNLVVPNPSR